MPTYEYRCEQGHQFEVVQRMADDPVSTCQTCAAPVTRVFHPVAVHFKGSGFYNTDYGTRKRSREKEASKAEGKSEGAKDSSNGSSSSTSESSGSKAESSSSRSDSSAAKADSGAGKSEKKKPAAD
jgi:putative FmdB family regulatory protein